MGNIQYVLFDDEATESDITDIRLSLESLIDQRISYNNVSKLTDTIPGLKTTVNLSDFIEDNSDTLFDSIYKPKGSLNNKYADILFGLKREMYLDRIRMENNIKFQNL